MLIEVEIPQGGDSVKKPRTTIKLNTTSKTANGTSTPKTPKESTPKTTKPKKTKTPKTAEAPEVVAPKEPELSVEEKRAKKEVSHSKITSGNFI